MARELKRHEIEASGERWIIYHKDEAGCPEAHEGGPWFYEPADWGDSGDVYSKGFPTAGEAEADCREWAEQQASEQACPQYASHALTGTE